ncbi:hypothetical protein RhiirA4_453866 [Rhizophagus irregularis]|uniref:Uncharacterized protein n=1 Tax=Rhizophagus irregularis TaxID=588596 RepID=A0A2I1G1N9_9GLOM|nr:hypothetical protein RhiirA4_453866 [Rhizophagus irregularis]
MPHACTPALQNKCVIRQDGNSLVGDLKKIIKAENLQTLVNGNSEDIKLWKVEIGSVWSANLNCYNWKASAKDILKGTWCRKCSTPGRKRVIPNQKIISVQEHITLEQECTVASESVARLLTDEGHNY